MSTVGSIVIAAVVLAAVFFVGLVVIGVARGMSKHGTPWQAFMRGYREGKRQD